MNNEEDDKYREVFKSHSKAVRPRSLKTEGDKFRDVFDEVLKIFKSRNNKKLSAELEERVLRWKVARNYFLTFRPSTDYEVVQHLVDSFSISESSAYHDVRDTKRFFAEMEEVNKEFDLVLLKAQVRKLREMAIGSGKMAVAARCDANLIALGDFNNLTDDKGKGMSELTINMVFNPKLLGAKEIPNLEKTVSRFIGEAAKRELMIEDIDFDEIINEKSIGDSK